MRNLKKILIVVCVLALLTVSCVVMALATDGEEETANIGSVAELSELVSDAETATDIKAKYDKIKEISDYLDTKEMDTAEEGYGDVILRINAVAVDAATMYLDTIPEDVNADGVDVDAALDAFMNADELLNMFDIPNGTAGFSAVKAKYDPALVNIATIVVKDIDAEIDQKQNPETAKNKVKINKADRIITYCTPYGDGDVLAEVRKTFEACVAAHNVAVEKNLAAIDKQNDVGSYDLPIYYTQDWQKSDVAYGEKSVTGWSVQLQGTSNKVGIREDKNGNKYYVHEYHEKTNPAGSYIQMGLGNYDTSNGIVFEFDMATFSEIPEMGITIETGSVMIDGNKYFPPAYLKIDGNGNIISNDETTVLFEGAFGKGGWTHVIIALDPVDFVYNVYIEGQFIAQYTAKAEGKYTFNHSSVSLRLSGGPSTQGEIAYDNLVIYAGDNYRNPDRVANMTDPEKFIYFVDAFSDGNAHPLDRNEAYIKATELLPLFCTITDPETGAYEYTDLIKAGAAPAEEESTEGEETEGEETDEGLSEEFKAALRDAVDRYMKFDIEDLLSKAKLANLDQYISKVEALRAIERSYETVGIRESLIAEIADFVKKNGNLIDYEADNYASTPVTDESEGEESTESTENTEGTEGSENTEGTEGSEETEEPAGVNGAADFEEYNIIYNRIVKQTEYDKNSEQFIKYMERFMKATTLAATERYYDNATDMLDNDMIDLVLIQTPGTEYRENFEKLIEAYDVYVNAHAKVDTVSKENNAKKIVQCIGKINHYRTEEQWEANKEEINKYINIIKDMILGEDANGDLLYDTSYEGIDEAVRFFDRVYGYFYAKLQLVHIEYISDILNRISATDDYVEKIGLIALIDRYVDTNEIDFENAEVIVLLDNLDTCKSELELRSEDYSKVLEQNSGYFVNYVEKMRTATTYAEQVANFEAAALLYFSLDTTVEGTPEAIEIYDGYKEKLDKIKESSVKFIEAVLIYKACETPEDQYAALVECYYNAQFAEPTYEGVAEAMTEYKAAYDAYVSYANAVNNDITLTGNAIGSFRANCGITMIIAIIIKKIFGV